MILIMKRYITLAVIATFCWSVASAQQEGLPSRSLTIEGAYNPTMTKTDKIMPVPQRPATERRPAAVSYLTDPNPITRQERKPMGAFSETSDDVRYSSYDGLVRFGYGLRNSHDGVLDFNWRLSDRDILHVDGLLDAWASKPVPTWKSRMFNADLNAEYSHRFDQFTFSVNGAIGHSHFNYREGASLDSAKAVLSSLMQKVSRGELGVSLAGKTDEMEWHFKTGMELLSRKGLDVAGTMRPNKERLIRIEGGAAMPLLGGTGGLDYRQKSAMYDWQGLYGCAYDGFTTLTFSPYWKQSWSDLDAQLGLNIDIRTAAGHKFMASPMVTASYRFFDERFRLNAGLTGGLEDNNMRAVAAISPYWSEVERIRDGYTLTNAFLGVSFSQGTWLTLSAKAGYRHVIDDLFQTVQDSLIVTSLLVQEASDVLYARLDADMQFTEKAQVRMDVTYSKYTGKYSAGSLMFKPVVDASLFGRVNIIPGLDALLTYRHITYHKIDGVRMHSVNDLGLTFDYDFRPNLSFYLTGSRLAGGDYCYYAGYRAIKPAVLLGVTYRF